VSNRMLERFREYIQTHQFNAIKMGLASPEKILSLSYGEVKKIETINYRTLKPERDGLFCARIFGPVKDWECNCGKYKRMKHRGITCEKCGVEVIQSRVRRERMGHINLVAPVCHIWYLKGIPSYLGLILDMPVKDLERIIYFDAYLVLKQGKSPYVPRTLLTAQEFDQYVAAHLDDSEFFAETGAVAIQRVLSELNLSQEFIHLKQEYEKTNSIAAKHKLIRRMKAFNGLSQGSIRPEWMIMQVLPVLPPDLRPLVPIEGGRFASSDLNELYRRVLNRNIRLQRLIEIEAPDVIIKNEKRMLQESVDALIDNGRRGQAVRGSNRRPLKSLSEMLRGKQGRFRQNLLGKRVDYSGRSVIVVDPELKIDQCGLPKIMALELFKAHIFAGLLERELAPNLRVAKRMVEECVPEVWDVLADVVKDHVVLLNRAPTLHRLGIQGFYPILVDGKAIKIHPLVCHAFNADFDGDQMAVHVPLSKNARSEAQHLTLSSHNLLSAANGNPVMVPSQDMILGLHYLTKARCNVLGEGIIFSSRHEAITALQHGKVSLNARVKIRIDRGEIVDTTVGRIILWDALPQGADFQWVNKTLVKGDVARLVEKVFYAFGNKKTVIFLDNIKWLGFYHSTMAGISFSIDDLLVPEKKDGIIRKADKEAQKVEQLYVDGVITNGERQDKILGIWNHATTEVAQCVVKDLEKQDQVAFTNENGKNNPFNPIYMMLESGARGSREQIKQLVGMRGLMAKPSGEVMETPIKHNFKEGLSVFEYFISTHGARKGQADTALKTASSGYLTRKLCDVAQDVVVTMQDCKTAGYIEIEDLQVAGEVVYSLTQRIYGRVVAVDVRDPISGELLVSQGTVIRREHLELLKKSAVSKIRVRSVLMCQSRRGICVRCYGLDLSTAELVDIGATVGIIAAQSIGEPGTQLTMKTFHVGGTATLSEQSSFVSKHVGVVRLIGISTVKNRQGQSVITTRNGRLVIVAPDGRELQRHDLEYGSVLLVTDGQSIPAGTMLVEWDLSNKIIMTEKAGRVQLVDLVDNVTVQERFDETTNRSARMILEHKSDKYQPALYIMDSHDEELAQYYLPSSCFPRGTK